MPNHLKFCGCRLCRSGLHTKTGGKVARRVVRKFRHIAKQALNRGDEPEPKASVGRTD